MIKVLTGGAFAAAAAAAITFNLPSGSQNSSAQNISLVLGVMAEHGHFEARPSQDGKVLVQLSDLAFLECEGARPVAGGAPGGFDILADKSAPSICAQATASLPTF